MHGPLVSVIIPTYNLSRILVQRSIASVLGQTYANLECIVVDDGSTDDTEQRVKEILSKDSRIRYFKVKNQGQAAAKDFGVRQARGEFIAFNDHDDEYLPEYLEHAVRVFEATPAIGYLSSGVINRDEQGKESYYLPALEPFWKLSIGNGWVFRAKAFREHNIHSDPKLSGYEDLDLHIQFHAVYQGHVIDKPLRVYYLRSRPSSSSLRESEYHKRSTDAFAAFFERNQDMYRRSGPEAFAWLCFFGGLVFMRAGKTERGKYFLRESWRAKKSVLTLLYRAAAMFGVRTFQFFDSVKSRIMRNVRIYFLNRLRVPVSL